MSVTKLCGFARQPSRLHALLTPSLLLRGVNNDLPSASFCAQFVQLQRLASSSAQDVPKARRRSKQKGLDADQSENTANPSTSASAADTKDQATSLFLEELKRLRSLGSDGQILEPLAVAPWVQGLLSTMRGW